MTAKILLLDIETAPNIAYVWGAFKQNVYQKQWLQKSHIMSFAAKWLGDHSIYYEENRGNDDKKIVKNLYDLLDQADIVVAHNGRKFDLPVIIGRGVVHGYTPPSPYFVVDTLEVARKELRFVSNSLENLCEEIGLPRKSDHKKYPGFELWLACLQNDEGAWQEMKLYNIDDLFALEALYLRMRPYMKSHPNVARVSKAGEVACPKCGSTNIQWRGYYFTSAGLCYRRFQCKDCGGWGRVRFSEKDHPINEGRNAT
ncbi:MAG: ribonuclease H-like domain-containing protein [Bacteroidetes bacterium]|nr:ribonuclease H-like domain-containing protein [Bacteroidota bacterium]